MGSVDKWTNLARLLKNKNEYAGTLFLSVHLTTKENLQQYNIMYQVNNLKISVDTRWTLGGQNGGLVDTNKKDVKKHLF